MYLTLSQGTPWFYLTAVEKKLRDEMHQVSDMKYMHQQQLKKRCYQLTTADGQDVKTAVTKGAAGYITVAVSHMGNNSCQSYSNHHQHEPDVT